MFSRVSNSIEGRDVNETVETQESSDPFEGVGMEDEDDNHAEVQVLLAEAVEAVTKLDEIRSRLRVLQRDGEIVGFKETVAVSLLTDGRVVTNRFSW